MENKPEIDLSFNEIIKKYGLLISSLSRRMIRNTAIAEEAAQEVWFEILKSIHTFQGKSEFSTWIYTIAHRTIIRYAREERILKTREINQFFDLPEITTLKDEKSNAASVKERCDECLTAFCHCINNRSRLIFLFREIVGLSFEQISQIMETSEVNIRKDISRSRIKVRHFMEKDCILYNQDVTCKCRIKKFVSHYNIQEAYKKLGRTAKLARLYQKFDKELPRKNYWEKFLID